MMTLYQKRHINILLEHCQDRKIEIPEELLEEIEHKNVSAKRASEIIDDLKFELGWRS